MKRARELNEKGLNGNRIYRNPDERNGMIEYPVFALLYPLIGLCVAMAGLTVGEIVRNVSV